MALALYSKGQNSTNYGLLLAGATVVVHALNPVYTRWRQELMPMARQGMDLAQRLGATFMLPGNVYNFGSTMPPRHNLRSTSMDSSVSNVIVCKP